MCGVRVPVRITNMAGLQGFGVAESSAGRLLVTLTKTALARVCDTQVLLLKGVRLGQAASRWSRGHSLRADVTTTLETAL